MEHIEIIKQLAKAGWTYEKRGRHPRVKKDGIAVPIPLTRGKGIKIGTLKSIQKSTGVKLTP